MGIWTEYDPHEWITGKLESILATTARLLAGRQQIRSLSILINAKPSISCWESGSDGYVWKLGLQLPADVYSAVDCRQEIESDIDYALNTVMGGVSDRDSMFCRLQTAVEVDPDWRLKARQVVNGGGITNQGRVRSDNIAARQHDGLLFRSRREVLFFDALKRQGVPFAPLAVFLRGGYEYRRAEPDFVIFKDGITMIVEIDGDLYHTENPAAAHARLKFLTDEGAKTERISASACDTPEKAREAVERIIRTIDKLRGSL